MSSESSFDLLHRSIVRAIAQTRRAPWIHVFPLFNEDSLNDMMEIVQHPKGSLSIVVVIKQDGRGEVMEPLFEKLCNPQDL